MRSSLDLIINGVQLKVDYCYTPPHHGVFDREPENCYPDEEETVEIERITIGDNDVTQMLSEYVIVIIEEKILNQQRYINETTTQVNYCNRPKNPKAFSCLLR